MAERSARGRQSPDRRRVGQAEGRLSTDVLVDFVDLQTKQKALITPKPLANIDGLELDGRGGYIVTDYLREGTGVGHRRGTGPAHVQAGHRRPRLRAAGRRTCPAHE